MHPAALGAHPAPAPSPATVATVVIPARYDSTRLPGKPLADICGRPMIEHVYRRASEAVTIGQVIVATDDSRIANAVMAFGGDARLTRADHRTGSDRLAEVARDLDADVIVNVQGDEPLVEPGLIDRLVAALTGEPALEIVSACCPIGDPAELESPHVVKVVADARGDALYFSRAPIPHRVDVAAVAAGALGSKHIGLYAWRRTALLALASTPPTPLERAERLEQLRALESGLRIRLLATDAAPIGVDTPDDLERVRRVVGRGPAT